LLELRVSGGQATLPDRKDSANRVIARKGLSPKPLQPQQTKGDHSEKGQGKGGKGPPRRERVAEPAHEPNKGIPALAQVPESRPPGFSQYGTFAETIQTHGLPLKEIEALRHLFQELSQCTRLHWVELGHHYSKAHACERKPNYTWAVARQQLWSSNYREHLSQAFACRICQIDERAAGDGSALGGRGHQTEPGPNCAEAALNCFRKGIT
jgi:hypothetical protein